MIRRTLMRRAYNKKQWAKSRDYARKIIHLPKEQALARSVVIRSYWNQGQYEKVLELNSLWGNSFQNLADKSSYELTKNDSTNSGVHHPMILSLHADQPEPKDHNLVWNSTDMVKNFVQEGERLWMIHPHGWTHWDMPKGFSFSSTHPALLMLTAEVLLSPWIKTTKEEFPYPREKGSRTSLAFSAGTDSTAALFVMPKDTLLGYHRRNFPSILDHRNATRLLNHSEDTYRDQLLI